MNKRHHSFTRNGVTYTCDAHLVSRPHGGASIFEWIARTKEKEVQCFRFTGHEFDTTFTTREFEDEIVVRVVGGQLSSASPAADAILKAEALTPGRIVQHKDGRTGVVQELDVTRKHVLFEFRKDRALETEWVRIDDLVLDNYRATPPKGFAIPASDRGSKGSDNK